MNHPVTIDLALFLSFLDVENLGKGLQTKILPRVPLEAGQTFLLYPCVPETLGLEDCKNLPSIDFLNQPITIDRPDTILIQYYAECQTLDHLHTPTEIQQLAIEQNWSSEALQEIYKSRGNLMFWGGSLSVAIVQVYRLPQPVVAKYIEKPKLGKFSGLRPLNLEPQLKIENTIVIVPLPSQTNNSWIKTIADLGNRANEDQPKSTYQAGTDFENITAQALSFLGFTIEEAYHGGAGGLDLYCSAPYPLVVECKSGKSIPTNTCQELINLTVKHLGKNSLVESKQLIIGPGEPTKDVLKSAIQSEISIMKPQTLQKLSELQAQYPGAIDLFKFKDCLKAGQIDNEIQHFIDRIKQDIAIRCSIIQAVKDNPDDTDSSSIRIYYKTKYKPDRNLPDLSENEIRDILIELSSPLTGYLGREPGSAGSDRCDRFYFRKNLVN